MTVKIIADSTCDITRELAEKYDVDIVPLHIILGDQSFDDGRNITPEDIYRWSDAHNCTPTTSAPSIMEVMNVFEKYYREYDELLCFTISGTMSSSFNVFRMAAEELEISDRVYVVDSQNLCSGISLLILKAADMIAEGKKAGEIYEEICKIRPYVRSSFVVETLTFLHRGGRCSSVAALAGSALKLHPMIVVEDGKMHAAKKYRGVMKKVYETYVNDLHEQLDDADTDRVFVSHSGLPAEDVEMLREMVASRYPFREVIVNRAGGVISSHCGPGTFAVIFIEKQH